MKRLTKEEQWKEGHVMKEIHVFTASKRFPPTALGSVKGLYAVGAGQLHSLRL
jgi:hypothetical protein